MLAALVAIAASSPDSLSKLERCRGAVHGALETAAEVCRPSTTAVNLWAPETFSDECRAALQDGADAGRVGPSLPARARAGLVQRFDQSLARCRAPAADKGPPVLEGVNLWD